MAYQPCELSILAEEPWYYLTKSCGDKRVQNFPKVISPNVNEMPLLEFELAY